MKFFAWLKSLVQKFALSKKTVQPAPVVQEATNVAPLTTREVAALSGIDYTAYLIDYRTGLKHTPYTLSTTGTPLPQGWDWKEWAKVAGVVDPTTHKNTGEKIEPVESRQYVNEAKLDLMGFREALLNVPGRITVTSGQSFHLSYQHGAQSKGLITAVANGLNIGHGTTWTLGPGDYVVDFTGELPGRIAVKIRPAL